MHDKHLANKIKIVLEEYIEGRFSENDINSIIEIHRAETDIYDIGNIDEIEKSIEEFIKREEDEYKQTKEEYYLD